jgi:hypothetical protein
MSCGSVHWGRGKLSEQAGLVHLRRAVRGASDDVERLQLLYEYEVNEGADVQDACVKHPPVRGSLRRGASRRLSELWTNRRRRQTYQNWETFVDMISRRTTLFKMCWDTLLILKEPAVRRKFRQKF